MGEALDGRLLTRAELADDVARGAGSAAIGVPLRDNWRSVLKPAAFRGALCFAPNLAQKVRFTRPRTWLPDAPEPLSGGSNAALLAVVRRFLAAYGPATREGVAGWWGTTPAAAGRLIAALGDEVAAVDVEGWRAWQPTPEIEPASAAVAMRFVRLLPGFDPDVIGATAHAEMLMPSPHRERICRAQGWVSPVLLVDGRMDGV